MSTVFDEDFAGLAVGTGVNGRTITGSSWVWTNVSSGAHQLVGAAGGGLLPSSPTTNNNLGAVYFTGNPSGELIWTLDPTTGPVDSIVFNITPSAGEKNTNCLEGSISAGSFELRRRGGTSPGALKTLGSQGSPTEIHKVSFYVDAPTQTLRLRRLSAADVVLSELLHVLPSDFPVGAVVWFFGYSYANAPVETVLRRALFDNLASGAAAPVYTSATSEKTGKYTANIKFNSNQAGGEAFYLLKSNSTPPTVLEMLAANYKTGIVSGANTIAVTGLNAGQLYYAFVMPRGAGKDVGVVSAAGSFTTDSPLPAPGGSTTTTLVGDKVVITYAPTGTVVSATASLPVGATPAGAVAQGPIAMVFAAGVWTATFLAVPAGLYGLPAVLAANDDNPTTSITGAQAFTIIPLNGSDVPDGSEIPDVPVAFSGTVPAQAATVGVALSLNLAGYFTGTRVPFVGSLFAGSLAGSGLSLSGFVISGTPTSASTLAGLVVRATDADGASADTNAFSITISAAADTTAPTMTGALTVLLVAQTSYTLTWLAASDNVAVTGYEVSTNGGTSWVDAGNVLTYGVTGRTAGTTDQVRVRAYDAAGNRATGVLSTAVTLLAAPDTTLPVMTGTIAITARTHNSYTSSVPAATDNVGVTGYRVSQDGGTNWIDKAAARTHDHTGRTPGATDEVRWSARDAAGNWADPLALAVTLNAAPVTPVLSLPTGSATSSTAATGGVTTNKAGGTLYTLDAVGTPSATAIKAGKAQAVTATGAQTVTTTGLNPGTTGYQRHYVWVDGAGAESAIVRSSAFDTPAAPVLPPGPGQRLAAPKGWVFDMLARTGQ